MDFDFDVFVSYAHLDDAALGQEKGWVARLHETLEWRLAQLLGKPARIWRDPKLHGNDVFAGMLVERVQHAAVLLSVVTPRYVRSEWATRELTEFCRAAQQQGGVEIHDKCRIFKVLKTPVPLDQQVPPLPSLLGYEFFRVDPQSGSFREFDEQFGPEYRHKFLQKLDDMAQDLKNLLDDVGRAQAPAATPDKQNTIYLAITTADLLDERDTIRRELQQHGYNVLPARPLPLTGIEADKAVREDLARCSMSVHLVGKTYSLTPEGGVTSVVELQNEWAVERAEQGGFTRLVWIPPGLQVDDTVSNRSSIGCGRIRARRMSPIFSRRRSTICARLFTTRSTAAGPRARHRRSILRAPRPASASSTSSTTNAMWTPCRRGRTSCSSRASRSSVPPSPATRLRSANSTRRTSAPPTAS